MSCAARRRPMTSRNTSVELATLKTTRSRHGTRIVFFHVRSRSRNAESRASIRAEVAMHRAVSFVVALVVVAPLAVACAAHPDAIAGPEGPPRPRPEAGPPQALIEHPAESVANSPPSTPPAASCTDSSCRDATCPGEMVLVEGDYCTDAREECIAWEDARSNPLARCAKFAPSTCVGTRVHRRFCVDRDEYVPPGQALPMGDVSWTQARDLCGQQSKRLCKETEWEFACEGEQMLPYPTGYERDAQTCNFDKGDLVDPATGRLHDQREPAGKTRPLCESVRRKEHERQRGRMGVAGPDGRRVAIRAQRRVVDGCARPLPARHHGP